MPKATYRNRFGNARISGNANVNQGDVHVHVKAAYLKLRDGLGLPAIPLAQALKSLAAEDKRLLNQILESAADEQSQSKQLCQQSKSKNLRNRVVPDTTNTALDPATANKPEGSGPVAWPYLSRWRFRNPQTTTFINPAEQTFSGVPPPSNDIVGNATNHVTPRQ